MTATWFRGFTRSSESAEMLLTAAPHAIAQLSPTIRTIHTSPTTIDVPIEATLNRQSKSKLRNNQIKPISSKSFLRETGPSQQSAIQTLPSMHLLHLIETRRLLSSRRPCAGVPPKSFRRTEEPPPHVVRSGGSDMSEDDLGGNPAHGLRDQNPAMLLMCSKANAAKIQSAHVV